MPAERYYQDSPLEKGTSILLDGTEFHHLAHVMRGQVDDEVEVVNGRGTLARATITSIDKKKAYIHIEETHFEDPPKFEVILAQAMPRLNRLDFILEKGTELGMTDIWLFPGAHSERKTLTDHQIERLKAITIAAMKQCGRLYLPKITIMPAISQWPKPALPLFFGDVNPDSPIFQTMWKENEKGLIFAVGPESGFTTHEIQQLKEKEGTGVMLHRSVLRTDTASISALALINHWLLLSK